MPTKLNKARKHVTVWTGDADTLKELSRIMDRSQVELLHEAITHLAATVMEHIDLTELPARPQQETPHAP